jgi:hypothetical protein
MKYNHKKLRLTKSICFYFALGLLLAPSLSHTSQLITQRKDQIEDVYEEFTHLVSRAGKEARHGFKKAMSEVKQAYFKVTKDAQKLYDEALKEANESLDFAAEEYDEKMSRAEEEYDQSILDAKHQFEKTRQAQGYNEARQKCRHQVASARAKYKRLTQEANDAYDAAKSAFYSACESAEKRLMFDRKNAQKKRREQSSKIEQKFHKMINS